MYSTTRFLILLPVLILAVLTPAKAHATQQTATYEDCTITYNLFGAGDVEIATVNVNCSVNHQITVTAYLSPSNGGLVSAGNSGYSNNIGVGVNHPVGEECPVPYPVNPSPGNCYAGTYAYFELSIDGYPMSYELHP